jgi:hypothetical protein
MSNTQRVLLFFAEDTDASEDFQAALDMAQQPPWEPMPEDGRFGDPQERLSQEETDKLILKFLKRAANGITFGSATIVP